MLSVVLHAALLGFIVLEGERLWQRRALPAGAPSFFPLGGGGGGGNRMAYITLPPAPKAAPPPVMPKVQPVEPPVETPPVEETPVPVHPVVPQPVDSLPAATASGAVEPTGLGAGPGADRGLGGGEGGGVGPGTGEGVGPGPGGGGGTIRPPELRDLAFPFDKPPKELRGASLNVTFWVKTDGRVDRYQVDPAIADNDYARKFDEVIRAFRFTPARMPDGTRVAGTTTVTFTLPGKRSS